MMEGVDNWFELAVENSLNVPHPADVEGSKARADGKTSDHQPEVTPFRILIKSLEILPSSVSSVRSMHGSFSDGDVSSRLWPRRMKCNSLRHYSIVCTENSTGKQFSPGGIEVKWERMDSFASRSTK